MLLTPLSLMLCTIHPAFLPIFRGNSQRIEHNMAVNACHKWLPNIFGLVRRKFIFFKESREGSVQPTPSYKTYASIYQNYIYPSPLLIFTQISTKNIRKKMLRHIHLPNTCFLLVSFLWVYWTHWISTLHRFQSNNQIEKKIKHK